MVPATAVQIVLASRWTAAEYLSPVSLLARHRFSP